MKYKTNNICERLIILNFIEFAIWGSYLTSLGNFLGHAGLGRDIYWFYTVQGIVSLFMPMLMGQIADRWIEPRRVLSLCHLCSGLLKIGAVVYCLCAPAISFWPLFGLFGLSVAFYIPTIGLNNALAMGLLRQNGLEPQRVFPRVRVFGTVGFIGTMLAVNFIRIGGESMQSTVWQLGLSGILALVMAFYVPTLPRLRDVAPKTTVAKGGYARLLGNADVRTFLLFTFLISVCLQITNSYANPYISSFAAIDSYRSWWSDNANALLAVSQVSETLCVLIIPFCLRSLGIKRVMMAAALAWMLRFGFFGIGNTGSGIVWLLLSMVVYGVAFDFVNIAGAIYLDSRVGTALRNRVQGLFMLVMSGLGATIGTPLAGQVVNRLVYSVSSDVQLQGWQESWFLFAGYSFVVALSIWLFFRKPSGNVVE